jgi:hypothetical protein
MRSLMRSLLPSAICAPLLCSIGAVAIAGAQSAPMYAVAGRVVGADASPVAKAEVRVEGASGVVLRIVQSDSAGQFSVERLSDVPRQVHVRAFGYSPRTVGVTASPATHRANVTIELELVAANLPGVPVTEKETDQDTKLAAYRDRKATNSFAHFVDGDEIERRKPQFVSEMLRSIGGVTLISSDKMGNILRIRGCSPLIWVDGVRMPGAQLDEVAPPGDVAGIEIYNSFAGIPSRYFDRTATCGTILVWLRS